jgi:hypothetical protein
MVPSLIINFLAISRRKIDVIALKQIVPSHRNPSYHCNPSIFWRLAPPFCFSAGEDPQL